MCCHIETKVADQTFHLTQSPYTDTGPLMTDIWQGNQWSPNFEVTGTTQPGKIPSEKAEIKLGFATLQADALTTRPIRR